MIGRLEVIAFFVGLLGLVIVARSAARLVREVRRRFTYGAPYRAGGIADRAVGLAMALPVLLAGALLVWLALVQWELQPGGGRVRAGQIEARRTGWATLHVRFVPDPGYPSARVIDADVSGARWAVMGDFVTWAPPMRWLGLRDGHRLSAIVATNNTTGTSAADKVAYARFAPPPAPLRWFFAAAPWLPFASVRRDASAWFPPAERQVMVLYALGSGYLADAVSSAAPARAGGAAPQKSN